MTRKLFVDAEVIEFCKGGRTAQEIADFSGLNIKSVYQPLKRLLESEKLFKVLPADTRKFGAQNHFFVTTGTELRRDEPEDQAFDRYGRRIHNPLWNEDFIRVAHNPFNLGLAAHQ